MIKGSGDSGVITISESSCGLNETGTKSSSSKDDISIVERILQEIVNTEADYVEHLRQVIQVCLTFYVTYRYTIIPYKGW